MFVQTRLNAAVYVHCLSNSILALCLNIYAKISLPSCLPEYRILHFLVFILATPNFILPNLINLIKPGGYVVKIQILKLFLKVEYIIRKK